MNKITAIDLFSGAGGLSEGFLQTGRFDFLAHVEWEKPMVDTLRANLIKRWGYSEQHALESVIRFDIQKTEQLITGSWNEETISDYGQGNSGKVIKEGLDGIVGKKKVDLIIGGPPCQAYSIAGRAQDPHSMKDDYRNYLFESFVKVVNHYRPQIFVFENVPGILSAKPGDRLVIERICQAFKEIGYSIRTPNEMKKSVYSAADYGVPQDRHRVIIFGVSDESNLSVESLYKALDSEKIDSPRKTVRDAIGHLPKFVPLAVPYKEKNHNISHQLVGNEIIKYHEARYHSKRDIEVFREWLQNDMNNYSTEAKLAYYKKVSGKTSNHNKYRNIEWDKPSPTIVSHLYKDGLMFIHPDIEQLRSITIKEAALLQTFPDDYEFVGSNAYAFKMIGNAVPVLFARHIAMAVNAVLERKK